MTVPSSSSSSSLGWTDSFFSFSITSSSSSSAFPPLPFRRSFFFFWGWENGHSRFMIPIYSLWNLKVGFLWSDFELTCFVWVSLTGSSSFSGLVSDANSSKNCGHYSVKVIQLHSYTSWRLIKGNNSWVTYALFALLVFFSFLDRFIFF